MKGKNLSVIAVKGSGIDALKCICEYLIKQLLQLVFRLIRSYKWKGSEV